MPSSKQEYANRIIMLLILSFIQFPRCDQFLKITKDGRKGYDIVCGAVEHAKLDFPGTQYLGVGVPWTAS